MIRLKDRLREEVVQAEIKLDEDDFLAIIDDIQRSVPQELDLNDLGFIDGLNIDFVEDVMDRELDSYHFSLPNCLLSTAAIVTSEYLAGNGIKRLRPLLTDSELAETLMPKPKMDVATRFRRFLKKL